MRTFGRAKPQRLALLAKVEYVSPNDCTRRMIGTTINSTRNMQDHRKNVGSISPPTQQNQEIFSEKFLRNFFPGIFLANVFLEISSANNFWEYFYFFPGNILSKMFSGNNVFRRCFFLFSSHLSCDSHIKLSRNERAPWHEFQQLRHSCPALRELHHGRSSVGPETHAASTYTLMSYSAKYLREECEGCDK